VPEPLVVQGSQQLSLFDTIAFLDFDPVDPSLGVEGSIVRGITVLFEL
jgi:hypothetical protein